QHASSIISGMYSLAGQPDAVLVQQRVIPDPLFEKISYQGTPDIRVIVYKGVPVMAILRLPSKQSGGRTNLHQAAIGAGVDVATGFPPRAVPNNRATERDPDPVNSIVGVQVLYGPRVLDMARRVSGAVGLGYIGVDIVLEPRFGPLLLEANARPVLAI